MSAPSWPKAPTWGSLCRIGGLAAILFVLSDAAALALYAASPPPVSGGEATLRFIADHKASYVAQQLLWLVPALFGLILFVALPIALFPTSPSLTVVGFVVGGACWTALLAVPVTNEGPGGSGSLWAPWASSARLYVSRRRPSTPYTDRSYGCGSSSSASRSCDSPIAASHLPEPAQTRVPRQKLPLDDGPPSACRGRNPRRRRCVKWGEAF